MAGNIYKMVGMGGAVVAAGYTVATFGSSNPVGTQIPTARAEMRTQGAQGEAVKSGEMSPEKAQEEIKSVPTYGGDKGFKLGEEVKSEAVKRR